MIHEKEGLLLIHPFIHSKISVKEKSSNNFKIIKENPQQSLKLIIDCTKKLFFLQQSWMLIENANLIQD